MSKVTPKMYEKQVFLLPEEFGDENGVRMKEYQRVLHSVQIKCQKVWKCLSLVYLVK